MDDTLRSLLLSLAEDLDPDVLPVLADRLEELGDARAAEVKELYDYQCLHPGLLGATCRSVLATFPEGPRWRLVKTTPDGVRWLHTVYLSPLDAEQAARDYNDGLNIYPAFADSQSYWPTAHANRT